MEAQIKTNSTPFGVDAARREELVLEQLSHVRFIARKIHCRLPAQVPLEDLVHAGVVGLLDAVNRYDPAKNVKLKAYAEFRIRGAILDSLREGDWSPRALRREARRLEKAIAACESRLGRTPTDQEIAAELEVTLRQFHRLMRDLDGLEFADLHSVLSEDDFVQTDLPACQDEDPFTIMVRSEMKELLIAAISELSERERQVLVLYHFKELPMKDVSSALGIGESRVSQIRSAALLRLRKQLAEAVSPALPPRRS